MNLIIYNPVTHLFDFFIDSLIIELNKRSINTDIIKRIDGNITYSQNDIILIIVNPHFIFEDESINRDIRFITKYFKYKILYITEPINFIVEKKVYLEIIKRIKPYTLWTYTNENFNKLNCTPKLNMFKIFPHYNDAYNFTKIDLELLKKRSTDKIIFFGNINENRRELCEEFSDKLINYKDVWLKEEWQNILNNNLFYLNVHRRVNCKSFESFRIIPLLANGAVIFSELCNKEEQDQYKDYNIIFVDKKDLYKTFLEYINNLDYESIYEKALLYRNKIKSNLVNDSLNLYLEHHNRLLS
jgi:hypothetical protein